MSSYQKFIFDETGLKTELIELLTQITGEVHLGGKGCWGCSDEDNYEVVTEHEDWCPLQVFSRVNFKNLTLKELVTLCRKIECTGQSGSDGYFCGICNIFTDHDHYDRGIKHKKWCPEARIPILLRKFGVDYSNGPYLDSDIERKKLAELGLKIWRGEQLFQKKDEVIV